MATADKTSSTQAGYKEKYGSMKLKLKDILYENELFQDELRALKRELLDIYRDKDALLQQVLQFEGSLEFSDESDLEEVGHDNVIHTELNKVVVGVSEDETTSNGQEVGVKPKIDGDSNSNNDNNGSKKICINLKPTPPKPTITKTTSNPKPKTTANRSRKTACSTASGATKTNANSDSKNAVTVTIKAPPTKKAANSKSTNQDGANGTKPAPIKKERKKPQPKQPKPAPKQQQTQQSQQAQQEQRSLSPTEPLIFVPQQQEQQQQQQQQLQLVQHQGSDSNQSQQLKVEPQQQLPITVLNQVSLPNDQMRYIQHVNLPVQNLANNNSMIMKDDANQIKIQPMAQQPHQNQVLAQQLHQIHFQLPQTTVAPVLEGIQTPQSIITTQGNQISFGGQNFRIVSSTNNGAGGLMQHDQGQIHQHQQHFNHNSPSSDQQQMVSQIVPMNSMTQQDPTRISPQSAQDLSPQNYHQQQPQTPSMQQTQQPQTPSMQQNEQHHQPHDNTQYQVVRYQSSQIIPIQVSQHHQQQPQQRHPQQQQLHQQQQQQQQLHQQPQHQQQTHDEPGCADVVDFEHHLQAPLNHQPALMIPDWDAGDIFEADTIKFMVED